MQHARVQPIVRKARVVRRNSLRAFVLMVGENKVAAASVNIEGVAKVFARHSAAFKMPTRPAQTPGRLPRWLARFRFLPQREVGVVAFPLMRRVKPQLTMPRFKLVDVLVRQGAIFFKRTHRKVHVTCAYVGMATMYQRLNKFNHFRNFLRCFRTNVGVKHVKRVHVFNKCLRVELRNLACRFVFLCCARNDFVVNVGDI